LIFVIDNDNHFIVNQFLNKYSLKFYHFKFDGIAIVLKRITIACDFEYGNNKYYVADTLFSQLETGGSSSKTKDKYVGTDKRIFKLFNYIFHRFLIGIVHNLSINYFDCRSPSITKYILSSVLPAVGPRRRRRPPVLCTQYNNLLYYVASTGRLFFFFTYQN